MTAINSKFKTSRQITGLAPTNNHSIRSVKWDERYQRVVNVNKITRMIGDCGRNFFKHRDRYAIMHLDYRMRLFWVDDYTEKFIYLHYKYWNRGFSHGGTLKSLVQQFKIYVMTGDPLPSHIFGPWPGWYCRGDPWGYGESMKEIREFAQSLGMLEPETTTDKS